MPSRIFIAREEKLMPGSKASKDRLTFLLWADSPVMGNFKLKPILIYYLKKPRALKNFDISSPLIPFYKWKNKAWNKSIFAYDMVY